MTIHPAAMPPLSPASEAPGLKEESLETLTFSALLQLPANTRALAGEALPEPYRELLVHEQDMTSTLQRYHRESLHLQVLERRLNEPVLERRVVLVGSRSGRRLEFGAIRIRLDRFPRQARREVLEGRRPLGTILSEHSVPYVSRPEAFLQLQSDAEMERVLQLPAAGRLLYGRSNLLQTLEGNVLARVLEILPP